MSIQKISKEQLRRMGNQEGLILQGCGGDPQEWLDGINQILTDEGILKKGTRFEEAYTFQHDGVNKQKIWIWKCSRPLWNPKWITIMAFLRSMERVSPTCASADRIPDHSHI